MMVMASLLDSSPLTKLGGSPRYEEHFLALSCRYSRAAASSASSGMICLMCFPRKRSSNCDAEFQV